MGDFFFIWASRRVRGRRFQASQTHFHGPTFGNVVPSRRAVGLSATMFLAIRHHKGVCDTPLQTPHVRAYRIPPQAKNISTSIPLARPSGTASRFAAKEHSPSPGPFSRAANSASGPSLEKMGTLPASGYRYATTDAFGRGSDSSCPCGCATARTWRNTHRRRCILGSITADSTRSFSPRQAATKATSAA